jgi:hypothetical protein
MKEIKYINIIKFFFDDAAIQLLAKDWKSVINEGNSFLIINWKLES